MQGTGSSYGPVVSGDGRYVAFYSDASNLVSGDTNGKSDVFVFDRVSGATSRVSVSTAGVQGTGSSYGPVVSGDGRFVAFYSSASNLVAGDTNGRRDVFVHDRVSGSTSRVSVSTAGVQGTGDSYGPVVSGDGRFVAFYSSSDLVAGDTNNANDVFVYDRVSGSTSRVSVSSEGVQGDGSSGSPAISGDGRYVALSSSASGLVSGDTNNAYDVFVNGFGPAAAPGPDVAVSHRVVGVLASGAEGEYRVSVSNPGAAATTGAVTVSGSLPGGVGFVSSGGEGWSCEVSGADLSCVHAGPLPVGGVLPALELRVAVGAGALPRAASTFGVTTDGDGNPYNDSSLDVTAVAGPDLALDKSHVGEFWVGGKGTYLLRVSNQGGGATEGSVSVTDTLPVGLAFVSGVGDGWGCGAVAQAVSCTRDGVLAPGASSDVALEVEAAVDVPQFVTNTAVVSHVHDQNRGNDSDEDPTTVAGRPDVAVAKSHTGSFRVGETGTYTLRVTNEGRVPTTGPVDVTDTLPAGLELASATGEGWECAALAQVVACAHPGELAAGATTDISLVVSVARNAAQYLTNAAVAATAGDVNAANDSAQDPTVVASGTRARVSVSSAGVQGSSHSGQAVVSGDGRYVAFSSGASNLVVGDTNYSTDVFVFDRETGSTSRVSVFSDGSQANGYSDDPSISGDGRYVSFRSGASSLVSGDSNGRSDVFVHDRVSGATSRVSVSTAGVQASGDSSAPAVSGDGRYVAFESGASDLVSGDSNGRSDVFVHDRVSGATSRVSVSTAGVQASGDSSAPAVSGDGRYVAFESGASDLVSGDSNGRSDVFVHDRVSGATSRVSVSTAGMQASGNSSAPAVSGDGRYVAYESGAPDLLAGDTNGAEDVFLHDRTAGTTSRLSVSTDGAQGTSDSSAPAIDDDGRSVAFQSNAANLVEGDTNGASDVFVHDAGSGHGSTNNPPSPVDDSYSTDEDVALNVGAPGVLANDTDADGDPLTAAVLGAPAHGYLDLAADGAFTYTPVANYHGGDSFTYWALDGNGGRTRAEVTISVAEVNDTPVAVDDTVAANEGVTTQIPVLANDTDADRDTLAVTEVSTPAHGAAALLPLANLVSYVPDAGFTGTDTFTYTVADGQGATASASVTVDVRAAGTVTGTVRDDFGAGLAGIRVTAGEAGVSATTDSGGAFSLVLPVGSHTLSVPEGICFPSAQTAVEITRGATVTADVAVANRGDTFGYECRPVAFDWVDATSPSGISGDDSWGALQLPFAFSLYGGSGAGAESTTVNVATNGFLTLLAGTATYSNGALPNTSVPNAAVYALWQDLHVDSGSRIEHATVGEAPNRAFVVEWSNVKLFGGTDRTSFEVKLWENGDVDILHRGTPPASLDGSRATIGVENATGTDALQLAYRQARLGGGDVAVRIAAPRRNQAPVAADDTAATDEDTAVVVDVLANDTDADGDAMAVGSLGRPAHGTAVLEGGGVRYTPAAEYSGTDSFTYSVYDGAGGVATATVSIDVRPVNDAPVARNDSVSTDEDTSVAFDVLANDTDADGDVLAFAGVVDSPDRGEIACDGTGACTYTPDRDRNGSDSFSYRVDDGRGGTATARATISVRSANDAPVAADDDATTRAGTPVVVSVLANDRDADADVLVVASVGPPAHGTAVVAPGVNSVVYTPDALYQGTDSFTYTIDDGRGGTATATVVVAVTPANHGPVAGDDAFATDEDAPLAVAAPGVLGNDSDPDDDPLTASLTSPPAHGTAALHGDGSLAYSPAPDWSGTDTFTYTVADGQGATASGAVTVAVSPVDDAPSAAFVSTPARPAAETEVTLDASGSADGDGTVVEYRWDFDGDGVVEAVVATPTSGHVFGTPGLHTVALTVVDDGGREATSSRAVRVYDPANPPPDALDDELTTSEDVSASLDVTENDVDAAGDLVADSLVILDGADHGTLRRLPFTTRVVYTPGRNYNGPDAFTYRICDTQDDCDDATVSITVAAVNDAPTAAFRHDPATPATGAASTFDATASFDVEGPLAAYAWDFDGDGAPELTTADPVTSWTFAQAGTFAVKLTVTDGDGAQAQSVRSVRVFDPTNPAPDAVDDALVLDEDTSGAVDVVANDVDAHDDVDLGSLRVKVPPRHGRAVVVAPLPTIGYVPVADYSGPDTIVYEVCDSQQACDTAEVAITVREVNDAPVPRFSWSPAKPYAPADVTLDASASRDVDGTVVGYRWDTDGDGTDDTVGTAPSAALQVPAPGVRDVRLTTVDDDGAEATLTLAVRVYDPENPPPATSDDTVTTVEDTAVSLEPLANDTDADLDVGSFGLFLAPRHGRVARVPLTQTLLYTPERDYHGTDDFTYVVCDTQAECSTARVDVTVTPVNDRPAPVVSIDTDRGQVPLTVTFDASATYDVDGTIARFEWDFDGDGTADLDPATAGPVVTHVFSATRRYRSVLTVVDDLGAPSTVDMEIDALPVANPPEPRMAASVTSGVAPLTVSFDAAGTLDVDGDPLTYEWRFGDGTVVQGGETAEHTYAGPGVYAAVLSVSDGTSARTASRTITVDADEPLTADAGDDQTVVIGRPVRLGATNSRPPAGIGSVRWNLDDGTVTSAAQVTHTYGAVGTYRVTLTVSNLTGTATATDTTTIRVIEEPPDEGLTVTVSDTGGTRLGGATVAITDASGARYLETTGEDGKATLRGLPDGSYATHVYAPGYKPTVATSLVLLGSGTVDVRLVRGDVGVAELTATRMTLEQIVAAGIDTNDPDNRIAYDFEIVLQYDNVPQPPLRGVVTKKEVKGGGGGGGTSTEWHCAGLSCASGGSWGSPSVSFRWVNNQPVVITMVVPGQAWALKEFFDVKLVVTNASPNGFTFTNGSAMLSLPSGLSLAPTAEAQSRTKSLPDIPGGESRETHWIVRGDKSGSYDLTADYAAELSPVGVPVNLRAGLDEPIRVWGGDALKMIVDADDWARTHKPYNVRVGLENVSDVDVYSAAIRLKEDGRHNFIYRPNEVLEHTTPVIHAGETFWADYTLVPRVSGRLDLRDSFVRAVGGDVDLPDELRKHPAPKYNGIPELKAYELKNDRTGVIWEAIPGATRYRVWTTPDDNTAFLAHPLATVDGSADRAVVDSAGPLFAVTADVGGRERMVHPMVGRGPKMPPTVRVTADPNPSCNAPINVVATYSDEFFDVNGVSIVVEGGPSAELPVSGRSGTATYAIAPDALPDDAEHLITVRARNSDGEEGVPWRGTVSRECVFARATSDDGLSLDFDATAVFDPSEGPFTIHFGDGGQATTGSVTSHRYARMGEYDVELAATSGRRFATKVPAGHDAFVGATCSVGVGAPLPVPGLGVDMSSTNSIAAGRDASGDHVLRYRGKDSAGVSAGVGPHVEVLNHSGGAHAGAGVSLDVYNFGEVATDGGDSLDRRGGQALTALWKLLRCPNGNLGQQAGPALDTLTNILVAQVLEGTFGMGVGMTISGSAGAGGGFSAVGSSLQLSAEVGMEMSAGFESAYDMASGLYTVRLLLGASGSFEASWPELVNEIAGRAGVAPSLVAEASGSVSVEFAYGGGALKSAAVELGLKWGAGNEVLNSQGRVLRVEFDTAAELAELTGQGPGSASFSQFQRLVAAVASGAREPFSFDAGDVMEAVVGAVATTAGADVFVQRRELKSEKRSLDLLTLSLDPLPFSIDIGFEGEHELTWDTARRQPVWTTDAVGIPVVERWVSAYARPNAPEGPGPWDTFKTFWDHVSPGLAHMVRRAVDNGLAAICDLPLVGQTVCHLNPAITLDVPEGALPSTATAQTMAIFPGGSRPTGPVALEGLDVVGALFEVNPDEPGLLPADPVGVSITWEDDFVGSLDPTTFSIWRRDAGGWARLPSEVDVAGRTVTAPTDRFGAFVIAVDDLPPAITVPLAEGFFTAGDVDVPVTVGGEPEHVPAVAVSARVDGAAVDVEDAGEGRYGVALAGLDDGAHTLVVTAVDAGGNMASLTRSFVVDTTAPAVPEDLEATRDGDGVDLSWSGDADKVEILRSSGVADGPVILGVSEDGTYHDAIAEPGERYAYWARSADAAGNVSALAGPALVGRFVAPGVQDDAAATDEDTATTIDVLANDAGGEEPDAATLRIVGDPAHGTATVTGGNVVYTPAAEWSGTDTFKYEVCSATGACARGLVTLTVAAVNDPPIARVTATPATGPAPLAVTFDGTASGDGDGSVVGYDWELGDGTIGTGAVVSHAYAVPGRYTATLTVTDDDGGTGTASATVVVTPPVATGDAVSVRFSGGLSYANGGPLAGGNFTVTSSAWDRKVEAVTGSGTLPGTRGGTATVTVSVSRLWIFDIWYGSVTVRDAGAGMATETPVLTGSLVREGNEVRSSSRWIAFSSRRWRTYTLDWAVTDSS